MAQEVETRRDHVNAGQHDAANDLPGSRFQETAQSIPMPITLLLLVVPQRQPSLFITSLSPIEG